MKKIHEKKQNVSFYLCLYPYGWPMSCLVYTKVRIGLLLSTTPTGKYYGQGSMGENNWSWDFGLIQTLWDFRDFARLKNSDEIRIISRSVVHPPALLLLDVWIKHLDFYTCLLIMFTWKTIILVHMENYFKKSNYNNIVSNNDSHSLQLIIPVLYCYSHCK